MNSDNKQIGRPVLRDLLVLLVLIAVFFCFMLGNRPLSVPDEARYVEIPREMTVTGDYVTPRLDGIKYFEKPVLFYWLEAFSIKLFGLDEFTLRLWPVLLALMGCLAVYAAGARIFGRRSGLIATAVLATNILYYGLGRAIILDMPVSALLTAALLSFLVGMHEKPGLSRRLYLWSFYVFSALAVLTKGLIGIFIPGMIIGAWILLLGEWRMLKTMYLPSGMALFLLIAVPWHVLVSLANPEFFHFYFIQEHFQRYLTKMHNRYEPVWFFIPVLLLGLFPWSAFLIQALKHNLPASWKERHEHRDALFLLLWVVLVFLFFSASDSKLVPYILPIFPPLALLIGRYLSDSWDSRDFPGVRAGYGVFLAVSLLLAGGFLVLPVLWHSPDAEVLGPYRYAFVLILAFGACSAWILTKQRGFKPGFFAVLVTAILFLVTMNAAAPRVNMKSIKPLALILKPLLKPGDEVASYATYYQDLPVYLERRILIVDWTGEIEFGTKVEDTRSWVLDDTALWARWEGPTTMYLVTETGDYDKIRRFYPDVKLYPVAQDGQNLLLSNREAKP